MWWLVAFSLIVGATGFWFAWRTLRRNRMPVTMDDALLSWDEEPLSAWEQDRPTALFLIVHGGSVLALAILALFEAGRIATAADGLGLLALIGVVVASWLIGSVLAFPVASRFIRPLPMRLRPAGPVRGQFGASWADFSHYTHDGLVIRLHSARAPGLVRAAWRPPDQAIQATALEIVAQYLPSTPPVSAVPWYRRPAAFIASGLALGLPAVALGLVLFVLGMNWGWLYLATAAILVFFLGAMLIGWYEAG